jgi:hypothetical protein
MDHVAHHEIEKHAANYQQAIDESGIAINAGKHSHTTWNL